jgi:hypothetical protein
MELDPQGVFFMYITGCRLGAWLGLALDYPEGIFCSINLDK